jgi:hypothetical protein
VGDTKNVTKIKVIKILAQLERFKEKFLDQVGIKTAGESFSKKKLSGPIYF